MSFIELKPGHRVNISQWAEVFTNKNIVSVVLTSGKIVQYELKSGEINMLFETMDKLDPTKNMKSRKSDGEAPPKTHTIRSHTVIIPDIAGVSVDPEKSEILITYQKLHKYDQMLCRGKYVVPISFSKKEDMEIELLSLNKAIRKYNDYYE